jgi:hypothetical protein
MSEATVTTRKQHLPQLVPFCRAILESLQRAALSKEKAAQVVGTALSGECAQCGIHVSGAELFSLSQAADPSDNPKVQRLRLGDCARRGCDSYYYRLSFQPHPELDWPKLISQAENLDAPVPEAAPTPMATKDAVRLAAQLYATRRVAVGLALVVVVLLVRQWYLGGRIPLLREPEHFRVAHTNTVVR